MLEANGYVCELVGDAGLARTRMNEARFDLLIVDLRTPGNESMELLRRPASSHWPSVIVVTTSPSTESAIQALRLGVVDYLVKPLGHDDALARVRDALRKRGRVAEPAETTTPPPVAYPTATHLRAGSWIEILTDREREIVLELATGRRVAHIADHLGISVHTVRNHLRSIFKKLGVRSQAELVERVRTRNTE